MPLILTPRPTSLEETGERVELPPVPGWSCRRASLPAPGLERLRRAVTAAGAHLERRDVGDAFLHVELDSDVGSSLGEEGYQLSLRPAGALLVAAGAAGISHGLSTLAQVVTCAGHDQWTPVAGSPGRRLPAGLDRPPLPGLEIVDRPALASRGVLLDVSRNRVPTMEHLLDRIEWLASLKVNHLQLYMEHTFAYRGHETVWQRDAPFTAEEIVELDRACRDRHIELAPNQNSFGHFHRWLVHDRYRPLAEVPEGVDHPFGPDPEPFSLCAVDPAVPELLADLYDQLLPHFSSETFNVGLDETFDLGRGRSKAACALRGRHGVYLDFLHRVHRLVADRGRRMQFWGDILLEEPGLVTELPTDVTCMVWGYEADHPFDQQCAHFAEAGVDFRVCPGTSSWLSFSGRLTNALDNLRSATDAAARHGASGVLVTDWGDWGHLQPPFASDAALLAGAHHMWNPGAEPLRPGGSGATDLRAAMDRHVHDDASGALSAAIIDLGRLHGLTGARNVNGSVLFSVWRFLADDLLAGRYDGVDVEGCSVAAEAALEAVSGIRSHRSGRADVEVLVAELEWTAAQLALGADLLAARLRRPRREPVRDLAPQIRTALARRLEDQLIRLRDLWIERSRRGGFFRTERLVERWRDLLVDPDAGREGGSSADSPTTSTRGMPDL